MGSWVLIAVILWGTAPTSIVADFYSEQNCKAALENILASSKGMTLVATCYRK